MERSAEQIIREKTKLAEEHAVSWNKERVWSNLVIEKKTPWHKFTRAAAVLFIFITASVYLSVQLREQRFAGRIALLENSIRQKLKTQQAGSADNSRALEESCAEPSAKVLANVSVKNSALTKGLIVSTKSFTPRAKPDSIMPFTTTTTGNNLAIETKPALKTGELPITEDSIHADADIRHANPKKQKVIAAIIGVIPTSSPVVVRSKKKKMKIYLNRTPDQNSVAAAAEEVKLYSAHLN